MTIYRMRLECTEPDWANFKMIMKINGIKTRRVSKAKINDYHRLYFTDYRISGNVAFRCDAPREFLIQIMKDQGVDLHYAYETIQPYNLYTGNLYE